MELKSVKFGANGIVGPSRNSMADELAAMANAHSGIVVLGVDDVSKNIRSQTRLIQFDEQVVQNAQLADLNIKRWQRFRTVLSPRDDLEFLKKMKFISESDDGGYHPTVSGILMASDNPENFISSAYIQAVLYGGTERNSLHQLDAKNITVPWMFKYRKRADLLSVTRGYLLPQKRRTVLKCRNFQ
ncbi:hypothetical protein ACYULU_14210 [Breznakiellaceae bacterium SP9]